MRFHGRGSAAPGLRGRTLVAVCARVAMPTVGLLSRRGLRGSEAATEPTDEHDSGIAPRAAVDAGRRGQSRAGGGSVKLGDVLLGDDGGEMW